MFKFLKKYFTRVEIRDRIWFDCDTVKVGDSNVKQNRKYIAFPDGLRIIVENGKYVGFYTQKPCV